MRLREVLGVDLAADRLHVVQVRRDQPRPVLTHYASRPVPSGADAAEIASILRRALAEEGFTATAAVFGLPAGRGFIQCRAGSGADDLKGFSEFDYVTDNWATGDGREVWAVAARADVTRILEVASRASLRPVAVDLRAMALLTALGLLTPATRGDTTVGIVLGASAITIALVDRHGVLSVQDRSRTGAPQGALERWESMMSAVEKMWRLAKMDHPDVQPTSARVLANEQDAAAAETLQTRLGLPVTVMGAGQGDVVAVEGPTSLPIADYAAAVGLALEGLQIDAGAPRGRKQAQRRCFNFLRPSVPVAPSRRVSWKKLAAAGAVLVVVLLGFGIGYTLHRHGVLADLENRYDGIEPELTRQRKLRRQWKTLGWWVSRDNGGRRIAYRELFDEIARQYPRTDQAHISSLTVGPDEAGGSMVVRLDGRARGTDVLYAFLNRLRESPMFARARLGAVTDEAGESAFPKRFSITFHLRGAR